MTTDGSQDSGVLSTHPTADLHSEPILNEFLSIWDIPKLFFIIHLKFKFTWQSYVSICKVYQIYTR